MAISMSTWRTSIVRRLDDIVADATVAHLVFDQFLVKRLELHPLVGIRSPSRVERRRLHEDEMLECSRGCLCPRVHSMPDRSALHEDDGMVPVLACNGRRQPYDESGLGWARAQLEAVGRQVMTLVNDQMAVLGHAVINHALPDETLNDGDVEQPGRPASAAANATNRLGGHAEERREPLDPLVEQLTPMDDHERAHAAPGDEPGGDYCLAKRRRGGSTPASCAGIAFAASVCSARSSP